MAVLSSLQRLVAPASFLEYVSLLFKVWLMWYVVSTVVAYRRLRHIPGPPLAAVTSLWWITAAVSEKGHLALADVCTRYGMGHV